MIQDRLPGTLLSSLDTFDSGGFVVNISTVYDVDKDGDYERPSGTPDDPDSPDQAYDEAIYVRGYVRTGACCINNTCVDMYQSDCDTNGGVFQGTGSVCEFTQCATPVPNLTGVVSKGTSCNLTIPLAGTGTEPRSFAASTYRQIFTFSGPPTVNVIPVKKATTAAPTPVADGSVTCTIVGNALDCSRVYAPPATYTFDLTGISAGNEQIKIRMLIGDANADGVTNGTDRTTVIGVWTGAGFSCATDLNQDNVTNATDRTTVIGSWTSGNNTAP